MRFGPPHWADTLPEIRQIAAKMIVRETIGNNLVKSKAVFIKHCLGLRIESICNRKNP